VNAVPLTLKQANTLVDRLHRHHKPVVGHRFSIGAEVDGNLVGASGQQDGRAHKADMPLFGHVEETVQGPKVRWRRVLHG
jgi:hypothetical protein